MSKDPWEENWGGSASTSQDPWEVDWAAKQAAEPRPTARAPVEEEPQVGGRGTRRDGRRQAQPDLVPASGRSGKDEVLERPDYQGPPADSILARQFGNVSPSQQVLQEYDRQKATRPGQGSISARVAPDASVGSITTGLLAGFATGAKQTELGLKQQLADALPLAPGESKESRQRQIDDLQREGFNVEAEQALIDPNFESETAQGLYSGGRSLLQMTPGIAASILTRNPTPGLAAAGIQTEAQAYDKYRRRGATPGEAATGALAEGSIEVATELLPMGTLVDKFGKAGARKIIGEFLVRDMTGEQIATFTQDAVDTAIANPDKTWGEFMQERPSAAYQTALGVLVASGAIGGASAATNYVVNREERRNEQARRIATESLTQADLDSPLDTRDIAAGRETIIKSELRKADPDPAPEAAPADAVFDPAAIEDDWTPPDFAEAPAPRARRAEPKAPPTGNFFDKMVQVTLFSESRGQRFGKDGKVLTSPAGAKGEMQVMDGTNTDPGYGVRPAQNNSLEERARVGRDYIAAMLREYGNDPAKAWAAYNAGPGRLNDAIKKHGENWLANMPAETRNYVMQNLSKLGSFNPQTGEVAPINPVEFERTESEDAIDFARRVLGDDFLSRRREEEAEAAPVDASTTLPEIDRAEAQTPAILPITEVDQSPQMARENGTLPDAPEVPGGGRIRQAPLEQPGGNTIPASSVEVAKVPAVERTAAPTEVTPVRIEPTESGKGIALFDVTPEQQAALDAALGDKISAMRRKDGAVVYSAKHETKIRNALSVDAGLRSATVGGVPLQQAADQTRAAMRVKKGNAAPQDILKFVARQGGLSYDGLNEASRNEGARGHDLRNTGSMSRFVPGAGPLLRPNGKSLDQMGELLWEAGYFGPPESTPRPDENAVLAALEQVTRTGEKRYSLSDGAPDQAIDNRDEARAQDDGAAAQQILDVRDAWDQAAARLGMDPMFASEISDMRAQGENLSVEPLDPNETDPDKIMDYMIRVANAELDDARQDAYYETRDEFYAETEEQFRRSAEAQGGDRAEGVSGQETVKGNARAEQEGGDDGAQGARNDGEAGLDRGPATDPNTSRTNNQRAQLAADAPLRGENRTGQAQDGTMGMGLFDAADQPQMDLAPRREALPEEVQAANDKMPEGYALERDTFGDFILRGPSGIVSPERGGKFGAGNIASRGTLRNMGKSAIDRATKDASRAAPAPAEPASQSVRRETNKKNKNALVRNGERYTLSKDVDYLSAGQTYVIEGASAKSAYFRNPEGSGTSLQNFQIERALRDGSMVREEAPAAAEAAPAAPASYGSANKVFTADAAAAAREVLRKKMSQLNAGFDPEIAQAGLTLMGYHIEAGARTFIDAARAVASDLGMTPAQLRNSLRSWYSSARIWMEDNDGDVRGMDDDATVRVDLGRIEQWGNQPTPEASPTPAPEVPPLQRGADDFAAGRERRAPQGLSANESAEWYRGWDRANLAAPVPGFTEEEMAPFPSARAARTSAPTRTSPSQSEDTPALQRLTPLQAAFGRELANGGSFGTITEARTFAQNVTGETYKAGTPEAKTLDEAIEAGVVYAARQIAARGGDPSATYDALVNLYASQPKLGVRSSTSVIQQAYSTPVPLAYLASRLAGIGQETTVYEPSAGNGALLIDARATYAQANELNPERAAQLRLLYQGATVTENDATEYTPPEQVDAVIANPPFGALKDDQGQGIVWDVDGEYSTREIDHAIAMKALEAMKDGGKAVLIVGGLNKQIVDPKKRADAYNGKAKREFYYKLYSQYNVIDHFTVAGELYERQGAGWPVDVIVIDGRGRSSLPLPAVTPPRQYGDWATLKETMNGRGSKIAGTVRGPDVSDPVTRETARTPDERDTGARGERGDAGQQRSDQEGQPGDLRGRLADGEPAGVRLGAEREGMAGTVEDQQPGRPARRNPVTDAEAGENARQVSYRPGSRASAMDTLVPVNMGTAIDDALADLQQRRGSIDGFVADRLGYKAEDLSKYFGAEQVDALALGIDNIERGAGFINGDQTGIGKGRVAAGMIRYAIQQRRNAVFVTEKPNLYRDMYRDMVDIGIPEMLGRPLNIVMTNTAEKVPLDEEGKEVLASGTPAKHNALLSRLADAGSLADEGVDVLFTTYAQMQTVKGEETLRQRVIERLATDGIAILDESHNAGGTGPDAFAPKNAPRNRAKFARDIVNKAHGVLYSSATYAKRPDVMDLYSATDMKLAVPDLDTLGEVISKGGVPMQQVVASMLARSGQYVRRERSFDGITYDTPAVAVDVEKYGRCCDILKRIQDFSETYVSEATKALSEEIREEAKMVSSDNATGAAGAHSTNFTAIMHNVIDQMLLAFKAGDAADRAIAAVRNGEKPVITVANTLEAFLTQSAEDSSISPGSKFEVTFGDVFRRYLERSRIVTVKKPFAKKGEKGEKVRLTDKQLGDAGAAAFRSAMNAVNEAGLDDMPGSPIDYMISRIREAGLTVGEITGRGLGLEYRDGETFLRVRPQSERSIKGRIEAITRFNNGEQDVMILNRSGSTGLSLHASEKFKDQRPRRMILAQAEANIDTHMQMLGRVHRTGQVVLPSYDQLVADVPAEKRPAAVLAKKMASLNANTTAARDSALTSTEVLDFMNEYGDEVVARIMQDDFETHLRLGAPLNEEEGDFLSREGAARKVTGRIPLLPVQQQEELYARIEEEYTALLAQKDAAGENALEAKTFDLDAVSIGSNEAIPPADSRSPFADGVYVERFDVKSPLKPLTSEEVRSRVKSGMAEVPDMAAALQRGREFASEAIELTKDDKARERTRDRMTADLAQFGRVSRGVEVGMPVRLKTEGGNFYGVITEIFRTGKTKNPTALGSWKVELALANGNARTITMPFSELDTQGEAADGTAIIERAEKIDGVPIIDYFDQMQTNLREERSIVTGNLLAGFDYVDGKGTIINFTTAEGEVRQGIMLRRGFDFAKHDATRPIVMTDAGAMLGLLDQHSDFIATGSTGSGKISVSKIGQDYLFTTAKSKAAGGEFFTNTGLTSALGRDFVSNSTGMVARVPRQNAQAALDLLVKGGVKFEIPRNAKDEVKAAARGLVDQARGRQKRIVPGGSQPPSDFMDTDRAELSRQLLDQLGKMNLGDKVTLKVMDMLFMDGSQIAGEYYQKIIRIAQQANTDPRYTLDHEVIHALRDLGLFKVDEWRALERAARADKALMERIGKMYPDFGEVDQVEEAIAEMFAAWRANRRSQTGFVRDAFRRLADFFAALARALGRMPNSRDLFRDIERGDVGNREQDMEWHIFDDPDATGPKPQRTVAEELFLSSDKSDFAEKIDTWRTRLQDKMLPLLRTQQRIEEQTGKALDDQVNPYLQEELMTGRVGAEIEHFSDTYAQPLFDAMKRDGVSVDELETYLYARHAPERNARIASINPEFEEGTGSGMSDAEAAAIMERVEEEGKRPALERLARKVDDLLAYAVDRRVESGLLSEEEAEAWRETYEHYVPLRGQEAVDPEASGERPNVGSGINVRGKESQRAFGRRSRASNILAYSIMQAEEAIIRSGYNRVAQAFYTTAQSNPDSEFWTTSKITRKPVFNKATGTVSYQNQTRVQPEDRDFTVTAKFDGEERRVTLNRDNPDAVKLAEAMRNLNGQNIGAVLGALSRLNRFLSTVNTALNPEFLITNAFRDLQTAGINLQGVDARGITRGTIKDYLTLGPLIASTRGSFKKGDPAAREWDRWYREFQDEGGRVFFNQMDDLGTIQKRIEANVNLMSGNNIGAVKAAVLGTGGSIRKFIDNANIGVENAIRLAAYKNAREGGMSKAQAASLAKNLTVNFNRRGGWGVAMNSLYLFYNASVQGSARIITAMGNKRVRRVLYAAIATGFALEMLNSMLTGSDDDGEDYYDKISDFDKSRNLIVMWPGSDRHMKIPLPYGYNAFFGIGRATAEIMRGKRWQSAVGNMLSTFVDAFNPVGGTNTLLNFIAPTIADPFVDLTLNRDFADRPIMPEGSPYDTPEPDSQRYWGSVSPQWKTIASLLNEGTGGDEVVPGAIDVSPETLEYLVGYATGAAGTFWFDRIIGTGVKLITGEEIEANDLPMVRKVVGTKPGWYDKSAYYARVKEIEAAADQLKRYEEREDFDKADTFADSQDELLQLLPDVKAAKKGISAIRKQRSQLELDEELGNIDSADARAERDALKSEEDAIIADFNSAYISTVSKPLRP